MCVHGNESPAERNCDEKDLHGQSQIRMRLGLLIRIHPFNPWLQASSANVFQFFVWLWREFWINQLLRVHVLLQQRITSEVMAECVWTKPEQPCAIEFIEHTPRRGLRHAEFRHLLPRCGEK